MSSNTSKKFKKVYNIYKNELSTLFTPEQKRKLIKCYNNILKNKAKLYNDEYFTNLEIEKYIQLKTPIVQNIQYGELLLTLNIISELDLHQFKLGILTEDIIRTFNGFYDFIIIGTSTFERLDLFIEYKLRQVAHYLNETYFHLLIQLKKIISNNSFINIFQDRFSFDPRKYIDKKRRTDLLVSFGNFIYNIQ